MSEPRVEYIAEGEGTNAITYAVFSDVPYPTGYRGIVARQQRRDELRDRAKLSGVEGRLARFMRSQQAGRSVPL